MTTEQNLYQKSVKHRRRRYIVLGVGIFALAVVIIFGPALREQEPDYYNPARTALVNARLRFEESLGHEQALIAQLNMVREELGSAIAELEKAADLDPADRARIEAMRSALMSIEHSDEPGELNPNEQQQSYRDLLAQMDAMITEIDNRSR
jgi:chromosome segregation ATPase